ncbi:MAG: M48 family metalloprotease, partial [Pseudomonadota bacterium]
MPLRLRALMILATAALAGCVPPPPAGGPPPQGGRVVAAPTVAPGASQQRRPTARDPREQSIGDQEHPRVLATFGGAYENRRVQAYVDRIGRRLVGATEQPNARWTFTVLNTPQVNAFALPGGYVYVTRGLLALAGSEAEVAGVIGHEIAHVTAGHGLARRRQATRASIGALGAAIAGAVIGGEAGAALARAGAVGAQGYIAQYSQANEFEADELGVVYIARSGYDPLAQADFLETLGAQSALDGRLSGREYNPNRVDFFATHPANADRVRRATNVAAVQGGLNGAERGVETHLAAIDGMLYGDAPEQGFVRGRTFSHPELLFTYSVPQGFTILNSTTRVTAFGPGGSQMVLDGARDEGQRLDAYIAQAWVPAIARNQRTGDLRGLRRTSINGLEAAEAEIP